MFCDDRRQGRSANIYVTRLTPESLGDIGYARAHPRSSRLEDADFIYRGYSGEEVAAIHDAASKLFNELDALSAAANNRYFILWSYDSPEGREGPKDRLETVRDRINQDPSPSTAFLLGDLDETNEQWANFYLKFRFTLIGTDYVLLIAENNDGGHELELGEVSLESTYVFERDYSDISIENDIEYEKFDAMMSTVFDVMEENGRLRQWNTTDELLEAVEGEQLLNAADGTQQRIAFVLGARCGLRSHEILDVAPEDIVDTDAGTMLRVWHGKGDKFRETPVPRDLATTIRTVDDVRDAPASSSLVEITSTRSLRRWVRPAADRLYDEAGDAGWNHLRFHDLRRT